MFPVPKLRVAAWELKVKPRAMSGMAKENFLIMVSRRKYEFLEMGSSEKYVSDLSGRSS
jgi:hypothetical protein